MEEKFFEKLKSLYDEQQRNKIMAAYEYAKKAHGDQKRESGEPYINHPCAVAIILMELSFDSDTVIAALLHDVLEDTSVTKEQILENFGQTVLNIVQGVTKLDRLKFKSQEEEQAENLRKMFIAMSGDIRTIVVKLADRLHNMRTLSFKNEDSQKRIAKETLEIYAPIAGRLGISNLKCELEDLSMRYLIPNEYYALVEKISAKRIERQEFVEKVVYEIKTKLKELDIVGDVNGRPKHFYSIYKKMLKGKTFEQIYDLTAVRVIVPSIKDCYAVLGAIHTMWKPIPGRFKDYIAMPKPNMYQSLHTTVITTFSQTFEIQIRTYEMHRVAEFGIAAHWKYKEGKFSGNESINKNMPWVKQVMEVENDYKDSREFLDSLKLDLYTDQVYVFSPKGDVVNLPVGSTGVDFAYSVHSEVGNKCVGVKIDNKMVQLNTPLENGSIVEIITSNSAKGPSRDWLKFVKTPNARSKIRAYFKHQMKDENIKRGHEMLEREAKHRGYNLGELVNNAEWRSYIQNRYTITELDDLYASVGYGAFTTNQVILRLIDFFNKDIQSKKNVIEIKETPQKTNKKAVSGVLIKGYSDFLIRLSHCCNPVPGDKIVGYISRGRGVSIHRADCPNMKNMEPERIIDAQWPESMNQKFAAGLDIIAVNRNGLMLDISALISNMKLNLLKVNARVDGDNRAVVSVSVEIDNLEELDMLIKKVGTLSGIEAVHRSAGS